MRVRRGGVHYALLPGLGRRPAVVVSSRPVNDALRRPVLARITARQRERSLPTHVVLAESEAGLPLPSTVLCHELWTVPAEDLDPELGLLEPDRMGEVDAALLRALDLV